MALDLKDSGYFGWDTETCNAREMLEEVQRVGVFAASTSSFRGVTKVRILWTRKPWVSFENALPMFSELNIDRKRFANNALYK